MEESSEFLPAVDRAPVLVDEELEKRNFDKLKTKLFKDPEGPYLSYSKVPWKLMIRKEVNLVLLTYKLINGIIFLKTTKKLRF